MNRTRSEVWAIREDHVAVAARIMANDSYGGISDDGGMGVSHEAGAVAVIPVKGIITQHGSWGTGADQLGRWIDQAVADKDVKAIVLDVNSPGGSVFGGQEVAAKIRAARDTKPIVAVANSMMASLAYHIGSAATTIVATPSAEVGSIGVVMVHADWSKATEADGVKVTYITSSKYKREGNRYEALSDEARGHMQSRVDAYHDVFIADIAKGRNLSKSVVSKTFGEGRMFGADVAKDRGMIDSIATLEQTVGKLLPRMSRARRNRMRSQLQMQRISLHTAG